MIQYYLIPATINYAGFRAPKYTDPVTKGGPLPVGTPVDWLDFGQEPTFIVAIDTDAATHATIGSQPDVAQFPVNIDQNVGAANLATVQAKLEQFNIPGDAVTAATLYRTILKGVTAIFDVMQRYAAISANALVFDASTNLDRTLGSIPAAIRNNLQLACDQLGYDTSGLSGSSTIRDLLKKLATQPSHLQLLGQPL